jgi:protein SCO1
MRSAPTIRSGICVCLIALATMCDVARCRAASAPKEVARPPVANSAGEVFSTVRITPHLGDRVPLDVEFVDSDGQKVRLRDCFHDKPVILHLVYYECPMLCKLSADGLLGTIATLSLTPGEDYSIVTLSFDPDEGPELSARARKMAAARCGDEAVENGWRFLSGDEASIRAVTEAVGFNYMYDEGTKQYAHAAGIFVLTPDGTISRYLAGINYPPRDLRFSLIEASDGKIGTAIDQALLLCYMYDPAVGKYGLAIMSVMRISGALVITMGAAIYTMIRRERRKNAAGQAEPDATLTNLSGAARHGESLT